jgi:hypothetical protein
MANTHSSDDESGDDVRPLSFRDFPTELYWKLKEQAVLQRLSLKQYVIKVLEEAVKRDSKRTRSA